MGLVAWVQATIWIIYFVSLLSYTCKCSSHKSRTNAQRRGLMPGPSQAPLAPLHTQPTKLPLAPLPTQPTKQTLAPLPTRITNLPCSKNTSCCQIHNKAVYYDSTVYICCARKLNRRKEIGKLYCCGKKLYDPSKSTCCKGKIQSFKADNAHPRCCGKVVYDGNKSICCRRRVRNRRGTHARCCGGRVIDATREICCNRKPQPSTEGRTSCCGLLSYNPNKDTCCFGALNSNTGSPHCCETRTYDPATTTCCEGKVHDGPGLPCCARQAYNTAAYLCCGGRLVKRVGRTTKCCCSASRCSAYDVTSHVCCGGRLTRKLNDSDACCGTDVYDVTTQMCCGNIPLSITSGGSWRCCDRTPYNHNINMCCGGSVSPRTSRRSRCCGNRAYDPASFRCDDFFYSKISPRNGKYCGKVVYNPDTEICCASGHKILTKTLGASSRCCGDKEYNSVRQMCCNGGIVGPIPDGIPQCCRTRVYNVLTQRCSRATGEIVSRRNVRLRYCGTKMTEFDSTSSRCCGEKLYGADQACCQGKIAQATGIQLGKAACCNDKPYNKSLKICCNGRLATKARSVKCCGRSAYNVSTHACCGERAYPEGFTCCAGLLHPTPGTRLGQGRCCGGLGFNPSTQICCRNMIYHRETKQTKCCRDRAFEPSRNPIICCHGRLVVTPHGHAKCCGRRAYDPSTQTCCRARVHPANATCCGRDSFNPRTEICCGNNVYPAAKYGRHCCESLAYNAATSTCHAGRVHKRNVNRCGKTTYNVESHMCCAGRVRTKRKGFSCCGSAKYNVVRSLCCGDKAYPRKWFVCCSGHAADAAIFRCCGKQLMKIAGITNCCNGRKCNKKGVWEDGLRGLCEDGTVVFLGYLETVGHRSYVMRVVQMFKGKAPPSRLYNVQIGSAPKIPVVPRERYLVTGKLDGNAGTLRTEGWPVVWSSALGDRVISELELCKRSGNGQGVGPAAVQYNGRGLLP